MGQQIGKLRRNGKFLETYKLQSLNHEEIEHLNRLISRKKIESLSKNLPTNKSPGPWTYTQRKP